MNRRTFLGVLAIPMVSYAQQDKEVRPYIQVGPVKSEAGVIRGYFSPSCPYSRQYLPFFRNLAATLPANKRFEFAYALNPTDGVSYALAMAAIRQYFPQKTLQFIEASLLAVQDSGISIKAWIGIDKVAKSVGIPDLTKVIEKNMNFLQGSVSALYSLQTQLQITNTPTIAISGQYIVTPEFTNGDSRRFSDLVNALISMSN